VWAWLTPAWAATVRPTISAVAAMLSTAVIQRRIRRVIVTSLIRLHPVVPGSPVLRGRGRAGWVSRRAVSGSHNGTVRPLGMIGSPAKLDEN